MHNRVEPYAHRPLRPVRQRRHAPPKTGGGSAGSPRQSLLDALQSGAGNRAVASVLSLAPFDRPTTSLQRKGGGGGGTATGEVGIPGGETTTPSDRPTMASGYTARPDGSYDTPDGRTVSEAQAKDESAVINSAGIYMAAYMARYNRVKDTYGLSSVELGKLSESAGFLAQFKTGDVVLRLMDASDSEALARITNSQYSHTGIVRREGKRVRVLDSYPRGTGADATVLTSFEDFFSDHHGEKIVNALVLRANGLNGSTRAAIDALIDKYAVDVTSFDFDFRADNGADVLYCSELVTRVLREAGASSLPMNEFGATRTNALNLIGQLKRLIEFQKATGTDPSQAQGHLAALEALVAKVDSSSVKELFSPGSFERSSDFETLAGFERGAEIAGTFEVTVMDATVPDDSWDTPDPFVTLQGGLSGRTSTQDDTTSPAWNETFRGFSYAALANASFRVVDEDLISDDELATIAADIRPVAPAGQTFTLNSGSTTLRVKVAAEGDTGSIAAQAPRAQASLP